jgi:anti-sigma regulatory factor (Ser/Thr protein kinase)
MRQAQRAEADDGLAMRIAGGPDAAAKARRAISSLRGDLDPSVRETLRLLVTELVGNSVRHAAADAVTLRVEVGPTAVLTEVTDSGPGFDPARAGAPREDHSGYGLFLVERLAARWGVARAGRATRVWFELPRAEHPV